MNNFAGHKSHEVLLVVFDLARKTFNRVDFVDIVEDSILDLLLGFRLQSEPNVLQGVRLFPIAVLRAVNLPDTSSTTDNICSAAVVNYPYGPVYLPVHRDIILGDAIADDALNSGVEAEFFLGGICEAYNVADEIVGILGMSNVLVLCSGRHYC